MDLTSYVPTVLMNSLKNASELITFAYDVPFARAVVFGVHIGGHLFVEGLLLVVIIFLLSQKSYKPPKRPLTTKEIDELCDEWVPESLIPPVTEEMKKEVPVLLSAAGPHTIINGKEVVNFASANYLGLMGHEKLLESCTSSLEKYGVGSCGPRQFYGTIDVHLDCETRIAEFLGTPDSILYSYGLSTMFSAIPAFCKKGDIVIVDEGVHWGIQNGLYLSRSTIVYFKHNNMESLRSTLEKVTQDNKRAKKLRRYIVVEAVYQNSGQIAPLDEIIQLKEKYKFRVLLDESNSFGVLGKSGRGLTEHYHVPIDKIDIITAAMGHALASEGGFCTGSHRVIDHQENPQLITKLRDNSKTLSAGLSGIPGLELASDFMSPLVFLKLQKPTGSLKSDLQLLEDLADRVLKEHSVFVAPSKRSMVDKCNLPVGIRMYVSAAHTDSDLQKACESLKIVAASIFTDQN
ncbi:long chain base biosynthesis protein 1-like isoform X2 [Cynara cardunculus var. scolymus]|uniref:long chain base biosynthesis protein 1-like isoform X2 n=1 Tax=Cynara cardunculus var. scolymus TaxID=59895 RepID=UPI000D62654D|nr:long chain base biosynthesis protein 1-like isoform X2 [Cynara cardunculus var. scolymus]